MVIAKEADHASYTNPPETLRGEQNSFLRFIDENKDLFEKHSSLTYELRDEEQGWINSPTLDSLAKMCVDIALLSSPGFSNIKIKALKKLTVSARAFIIGVVLSNPNEIDRSRDKLVPYFLSSKFRPPPQSEAMNKVFEESLDDFHTSFREAKLPLAMGVRESKAELIKKFEDFLLSNPSNVFAFQDFLSDKKNYGADKEAIRPFLASLGKTEEKERILYRSVTKRVNELKENPTHAIIDEFTASIKSSNVLEWLKFAAQGEGIANFLKSRPDVSGWTTELRNALFSFVSSKYFNALSSIGRDLEQYRVPIPKSLSYRPDLRLEAKIKKADAKILAQRPQDNEKRVLEKVEKERYPIGILTKEIGASFEIRVLTEEELIDRLQKDADSFAPSDLRMMEDLKNILTSLQKDPYGLGTKKLTGMHVGVGNRTLPLRSINPGKRIGLSLDHPESTRIRIVYVIYRNEDGPVIGIEGIYKHEDYDKKFT